MEKEFIPYEQSLELKELGFDEECFARYFKGQLRMYQVFQQHPFSETALTPLYQQAFRFFRGKYGLYSTIEVDQTMEPKFCYSISKYKGDFQWDNILPTYSELYYTYEETELACLKKLIEIVK